MLPRIERLDLPVLPADANFHVFTALRALTISSPNRLECGILPSSLTYLSVTDAPVSDIFAELPELRCFAWRVRDPRVVEHLNHTLLHLAVHCVHLEELHASVSSLGQLHDTCLFLCLPVVWPALRMVRLKKLRLQANAHLEEDDTAARRAAERARGARRGLEISWETILVQ
jgi:hypothetical protein